MRQKKSNLIYYIITIILLAAAGFVILHEIPMTPEHIEEVIQ